jgi:hypothetical protein
VIDGTAAEINTLQKEKERMDWCPYAFS